MKLVRVPINGTVKWAQMQTIQGFLHIKRHPKYTEKCLYAGFLKDRGEKNFKRKPNPPWQGLNIMFPPGGMDY